MDRALGAAAVNKWPACAKFWTIAHAGHLPTAPTLPRHHRAASARIPAPIQPIGDIPTLEIQGTLLLCVASMILPLIRSRLLGLSSGKQPSEQNSSEFFLIASIAISLLCRSQLGVCCAAPFAPATPDMYLGIDDEHGDAPLPRCWPLDRREATGPNNLVQVRD
jgi:hypothetical protein